MSPGRLTGKKKERALAKKRKECRDLILRAYRVELLQESAFFRGKTAGRLVVISASQSTGCSWKK
jgi:site-specific DNA-methyltransferase (adenine-specific)/adenine-specific DNA-methyltransferase